MKARNLFIIKRSMLFGAALATVGAFTACSKDDNPGEGPQGPMAVASTILFLRKANRPNIY